MSSFELPGMARITSHEEIDYVDTPEGVEPIHTDLWSYFGQVYVDGQNLGSSEMFDTPADAIAAGRRHLDRYLNTVIRELEERIDLYKSMRLLIASDCNGERSR
ncbi:MAG: hypothetical protein AAFY26_06085 [Cyanobacteria bacterium J06638_22]